MKLLNPILIINLGFIFTTSTFLTLSLSLSLSGNGLVFADASTASVSVESEESVDTTTTTTPTNVEEEVDKKDDADADDETDEVAVEADVEEIEEDELVEANIEEGEENEEMEEAKIVEDAKAEDENEDLDETSESTTETNENEEELEISEEEDVTDEVEGSVGDEVSNEPDNEDEIVDTTETNQEEEKEGETESETQEVEVTQTGPFIDLFGETLLSLEMIDESHAQMRSHLTNDVLKGKKVIGLYFSADWCGPCRQFTPELVSFYNKMNSRRGKEGQFEIVWISRCRDGNSFGQYFTHMNWFAMQPELAMGQEGHALSDKYKVKSIPTLVLLDEDGNIITTDARNKVAQDRAGIGFPWRNPLVSAYLALFPKTLRLMIKSSLGDMRRKVLLTMKGALGLKVSPKVS